MKNNIKAMHLMKRKDYLKGRLELLVYGSVEVREKNNNKYIYVHYRENGTIITKYVGEYSEDIFNLILKNNMEVKKIKREIREIDRNLKGYEYSEKELPEEVKLNVDIVKKRLNEIILSEAKQEVAHDVVEHTMLHYNEAWEYVLNKYTLLKTSNIDILCDINKILGEGVYYTAGKLRKIKSVPLQRKTMKIPRKDEVQKEIEKIIKTKTLEINKAVELIIYILHEQLFLAGNEVTAFIFANHYLISHGKGILSIPEDKIEEWQMRFERFYEDGNKADMRKFLKGINS